VILAIFFYSHGFGFKKMKKKNLFLTLALVTPVLIFIFLKFFGKNKFEIPIFHQKKIEVVSGCDLPYMLPYLAPDSALNSLGWDGRRAVLFLFNEMSKENNLRVQEEVEQNKLQLVFISDSLRDDAVQRLSCLFLLPDKFNSVLVDGQKQIRGYYQLNSREEADRLIVELKILFNEF